MGGGFSGKLVGAGGNFSTLVPIGCAWTRAAFRMKDPNATIVFSSIPPIRIRSPIAKPRVFSTRNSLSPGLALYRIEVVKGLELSREDDDRTDGAMCDSARGLPQFRQNFMSFMRIAPQKAQVSVFFEVPCG
jgi:hypothetical protein